MFGGVGNLELFHRCVICSPEQSDCRQDSVFEMIVPVDQPSRRRKSVWADQTANDADAEDYTGKDRREKHHERSKECPPSGAVERPLNSLPKSDGIDWAVKVMFHDPYSISKKRRNRKIPPPGGKRVQ